MTLRILGAVVLLVLVVGCGRQKWHYGMAQSIFVQVPPVVNDTVFDEVGPLAYQVLYQHLLRVGYCLANTSNDAFSMQLTVVQAAPVQKFVTSDVVLVAQQIKLDLELTIKDAEGKIVAVQRQQLLTLSHKPRDPSLMNSFTTSAYQQGLEQLIPRLELGVRDALLQATVGKSIIVQP